MFDTDTFGLTGLNPESTAIEGIRWDGELNGLLLTLTCRQTFRHTGDDPAEAVYSFPLSSGSVVTHFAAVINGEKLEARILPAAKAEAQYEKSISEGDLPLMLEVSDPHLGIATANLGNLKKGDEVVLEISTAEMLDLNHGTVRLVIPTVVGERYSASGGQGTLKPHQQIVSDIRAEIPVSLRLTVKGACTKGRFTALSHAATVAAKDGALEVTIERAAASRDIALRFEDVAPVNVCWVSPREEGCAALAVVTAGETEKALHPAALKILTDCSGSMHGIPIRQVRQALAALADELRGDDKVSLTRFGSSIDAVIPKLTTATASFLRRDFLPACLGMEADLGGTEMAAALNAVSRQNPRSKADILLITDGAIWDSLDEVTERIAEKGSVHVIMVGSHSGSGALAELTRETDGNYERVYPAEDMRTVVARAMAAARSEKIPFAMVDFHGFESGGFLFSRGFAEGLSVSVSLTLSEVPGKAPVFSHGMNGAKTRVPLEVIRAEGALAEAVRKLVAAAQYRALRNRAGEETDADEEEDLAAFAAENGLLTPETRFILAKVRAEAEKTEGMPKLVRVPQMVADDVICFNQIMKCDTDDMDLELDGTDLELEAPSESFEVDAPIDGEPDPVKIYYRCVSTPKESARTRAALDRATAEGLGIVNGKSLADRVREYMNRADGDSSGADSDQEPAAEEHVITSLEQIVSDINAAGDPAAAVRDIPYECFSPIQDYLEEQDPDIFEEKLEYEQEELCAAVFLIWLTRILTLEPEGRNCRLNAAASAALDELIEELGRDDVEEAMKFLDGHQREVLERIVENWTD
ncbi:VIT and VWA domain-containing protein [Sutterella sp.]|uniref:VIT and vWA domain-containing protein n=1 Tax=Sutterella sp. TaxID=1981025 RepID=UPI0026E10F5D|nr:VIT and VWA domain-containing protein [Sutterella sp.]MDO5530771.1 VIT and VWA domain-containing protein [Sutterella sp.]